MKTFKFVILSILFIAFHSSADAYTTENILLLKGGIIPNYSVDRDDHIYYNQNGEREVGERETIRLHGISLVIEYNFIINDFLLGCSIEDEALGKSLFYQPGYINFLFPSLFLKYYLIKNYYIGSSISFKYATDSYKKTGSSEDCKHPNNETDIWVNGIIGFLIQNTNNNFYNIELRYGYNLSNKQWENGRETDLDAGTSWSYKDSVKSSYDWGIYFGYGWHLF